MKLSTVHAKLTCIKSNVVRTVAALTFAGVALAAAPNASAQHVAFGVQFGGPRYVAPAPAYGYGYGYGPRYDALRAHEDWVRHEEWRRREEWIRFHHQPSSYGYDSRAYGYRPY